MKIKQLINHERLGILSRSLNLALKELGFNINIECTDDEESDCLKFNISKGETFFVPNIEECFCPICGANPKLKSSCLGQGFEGLSKNVRSLIVICSNKDCTSNSYGIDEWISRYEKIRDRWWDPKQSAEWLNMRSTMSKNEKARNKNRMSDKDEEQLIKECMEDE